MQRKVGRTLAVRKLSFASLTSYGATDGLGPSPCVGWREFHPSGHRICCRTEVMGSAPWQTQRRFQSTAADKKFHCSICKKAFRLEMAAKVHLQQSHNGEGSVEVGSGPGQESGASESTHTPPGLSRNAPPQGPTIVEEVAAPGDRPLRRRSKPTPKPLHEPHHDVPAKAVEELLAVWDDVGVKRLQGRFVHSSMIMRVFAAKPDAGSEPLYDPVEPEGENPFAMVWADAETKPEASEEHNIYNIDLNDAFAIATEEHHGPFRVAWCENPFLRGTGAVALGVGVRPRPLSQTNSPAGPSATAAVAAEDTAQTAPVTPYGQLPMFGEGPAVGAPPAAGAAVAGVVASPFAASVTDSPFAQPVTSPFVASPLAATAAQAGTPAVSSPFLSAPGQGGASWLPTAGGGADAPLAAPSPFLSSPFLGENAPSGGQGAAVAAYGAFPATTVFPPYQVVDGLGASYPGADPTAAAVPTAPEVPQHECATCGKAFSTHEGMRMHAKAKHGVEVPRLKEKGQRASSIPELPAYIPSPVDLSMTAPFGNAAREAAWTETEIVPHAVSVSNITITGKVLDVETLSASVVQMTVFVPGERKDDSETLTVRWTGEQPAENLGVARNDTVFVSGTLRLLPVYDEAVDKFYASPIIFAACPTGLVQKIS